MDWQAFGFKDNPLKTEPITKSTLPLFTGHEEEMKICMGLLNNTNLRIVIEGARGIGTTSFGNYLRFSIDSKREHFTPRTEIKVEQGWRCETLLAAIINNLIREIELLPDNTSFIADKRFSAAKALSSYIAETYRSFGVEVFGFGASHGKQVGIITQPMIVPSTTLGNHLQDLILLLKAQGYRKGILLQLNNLDIGEIHSPEEMKYLLNALRDYTQIDGSHWLFVGDVGLRKFIAQQVDRLDDIISYEVSLEPLPISHLAEMISKRIDFYSESNKAKLPIDQEVFFYLYKITNGRLRYIFGLLSRLLSRLSVGDLTNKLTLDIAKPMLTKIGRDRVQRADLSIIEEQVLKIIVNSPKHTSSSIAKKLNKTSQYIGRVLTNLVNKNLILSNKTGRDKVYSPSVDAVIAYTEIDFDHTDEKEKLLIYD